MKRKLSYQLWFEKVCEFVWAQVACSVNDLPDCPFRDWYEDDVTPTIAAWRAISRA